MGNVFLVLCGLWMLILLYANKIAAQIQTGQVSPATSQESPNYDKFSGTVVKVGIYNGLPFVGLENQVPTGLFECKNRPVDPARTCTQPATH